MGKGAGDVAEHTEMVTHTDCLPIDRTQTDQVSRRGFLAAVATSTALAAASPQFGPAAEASSVALIKQPDVAELTYWHAYPEYRRPFQKVIDAFQKDVPGVRIVQVPKPVQHYAQLLDTAMAAGELPDLFLVNRFRVLAFGRDGLLLDLTGRLPNMRHVIPALRGFNVVNRKLCAVTWGRYTDLMFFHTKTMMQFGLHSPHDWDEWLAQCKMLKAAGQTPLAMTGDGTISGLLFTALATAALGRQGYDSLAAGKMTYNSPEIIAAIEFLLMLAPYFQTGFQAAKNVDAKTLFATGRAVSLWTASADQAVFRSINPRIDSGVFAMPPRLRGAQPVTITAGGATTMAASPYTKYPTAVYSFLNWLLSSKGQTILAAALNVLPVVDGITPSGDSIQRDAIKVSRNDFHAWSDLPRLAPGFAIWSGQGQGLFDGRLSPTQVANQMQQQADSSTKQ